MFDLEEGLRGRRVCICFEGVEQAVYVWLNGQFVGYAEDTFTPSEFDLSPYIREQGNMLAVEVYKNSTAAYLEDQDFFRFFGIFRNVTLYAKPKLHVEDLWVKPCPSEDLTKRQCVRENADIGRKALREKARRTFRGQDRRRLLQGRAVRKWKEP